MSVKYVIGHWTGVNFYYVTPDIKKHYQLLIDGDGDVIEGTPQGHTASTGGMNSITYNISCCGGDTKAPMKKKQCEVFFKECAKALKAHGLTVDKFYNHAEIGEMVRNYLDFKKGKTVKGELITNLLPYNNYLAQNVGKIDLTKLPYDLKAESHGNFIRRKIKWYFERL